MYLRVTLTDGESPGFEWRSGHVCYAPVTSQSGTQHQESLDYNRHGRRCLLVNLVTMLEQKGCCIVLLFYAHGKHLRSCRDGQLT